MKFEHNKELQNLFLLQKALKRNDTAEINKYRKITGVKDDYSTLCAKMRFAEIGMAQTYKESLELYNQERRIINEIEKLNKEMAAIRVGYWAKGELERSPIKKQKKSMQASLDAANKRLEEAEQLYKETQKQYEKEKKKGRSSTD